MNRFVGAMLVGGSLLLTGPATAFDASQVVHEDTSSTKIFEFFFRFKKSGKKDEAFEVLKYAADQGNSAAQWKLGRIYQTGDGVDRDPLRAFTMFQKVAERYPLARPDTPNWQFSADALVALGNYYKEGIKGTDILPDLSKAQMMFTTAAMVFRHPDAQFELGRMQLFSKEGYGQQRLGIRNLTLAHRKGHVGAQALLGYAVFEGNLVKRNPQQGLLMLADARARANDDDISWILPLYEEAFALATPEQRLAANSQLEQSIASGN